MWYGLSLHWAGLRPSISKHRNWMCTFATFGARATQKLRPIVSNLGQNYPFSDHLSKHLVLASCKTRWLAFYIGLDQPYSSNCLKILNKLDDMKYHRPHYHMMWAIAMPTNSTQVVGILKKAPKVGSNAEISWDCLCPKFSRQSLEYSR